MSKSTTGSALDAARTERTEDHQDHEASATRRATSSVPGEAGHPGTAPRAASAPATRSCCALVPVGLVVAAIATMVVIKAAGGPARRPRRRRTCTAGGSPADAADPGTTALSPSVVAALSVPAATLDAVGSPGSVRPARARSATAAIGRGTPTASR